MTLLSRGSVGSVAAEDRGVELAVEHHLGHVLALGGALDAGRVRNSAKWASSNVTHFTCC